MGAEKVGLRFAVNWSQVVEMGGEREGWESYRELTGGD